MYAAKAFAYALVLLPAAELAVFIAIAVSIGTPAAFALLILVSVSGVLVLRHLGKGALGRLRRGSKSGGGFEIGLSGGQLGSAFGAILLIVPGFLTGLLGAALVIPASRRILVRWFRHFLFSRRSRPEAHVVDLAPNEWQRLPTTKLTKPGVEASK